VLPVIWPVRTAKNKVLAPFLIFKTYLKPDGLIKSKSLKLFSNAESCCRTQPGKIGRALKPGFGEEA